MKDFFFVLVCKGNKEKIMGLGDVVKRSALFPCGRSACKKQTKNSLISVENWFHVSGLVVGGCFPNCFSVIATWTREARLSWCFSLISLPDQMRHANDDLILVGMKRRVYETLVWNWTISSFEKLISFALHFSCQVETSVPVAEFSLSLSTPHLLANQSPGKVRQCNSSLPNIQIQR